MLQRLIWLVASFALPPAILSGVYTLIPDWLLDADYRDRLSDDLLANSANDVFQLEMFAVLGGFGLALLFGLGWGWSFGRSRANSDQDAASKRTSWFGLLVPAISAVPALLWWNTSRADLPEHAIAVQPLILLLLLAVAGAAALYWLASHLSATPRMYPSIPAGMAIYRRWTHEPNQERRKAR